MNHEKAQNQSTFVRNTVLISVSKVIGTLAIMLCGILTARYLKADGKGQVALALGAGSFLGNLFSLGFEQAAPYFIASGKLSSKQVLGGWIITFLIGTSVTFAVVYPLLTQLCMDNIFKGIPISVLIVGGLFCPLYSLRLLVNSVFQGYQQFGLQLYHNISISLASIFGCVVSLVILGYYSLGYIGLQIAFGAISLIYGFFILRCVLHFSPNFSLGAWWRMFRYGIKSSLSQILSLVDVQFDQYVVNYFISTAVVGVYSVAGAISSVFWTLGYSVSTALFPRTAAADPKESAALTGLVCRNVIWITVVVGGLFLLVSKWVIVLVFGAEFAPASNAFALLFPGVIGFSISRICFADCAGRGQPGKATISTAITASLTILLDFLLIPKYSLYGASIASSIAYITGGVLGLYWHIKLTGNSLRSLLLPRWEDWQYYRMIVEKIRQKYRPS